MSESDIRKWAIAVYWPQPPPRLYWDPEYAKTTRWGGIVAPEDFNPFAWPIRDSEVKPAGAVPGQQARRGGNVMNGGQVDTFGVRMRPGDVITRRSRLSHWEERQGRNGLTLFSFTETEWRNQRGELRQAARLHRHPLLASGQAGMACSPRDPKRPGYPMRNVSRAFSRM